MYPTTVEWCTEESAGPENGILDCGLDSGLNGGLVGGLDGGLDGGLNGWPDQFEYLI